MNYSFDNTLKTRLDDCCENILVFATDKPLHERFTRKHRRCVFVLNNGYTASFKNNDVKGRIVFENRNNVEINKRFSSLEQSKDDRNEKQAIQDEDGNKLKQKLRQLAVKRRVVLMPTKLKNEDSTEYSHNAHHRVAPVLSLSKNADASTPKRLKMDQGNAKDDSVVKHFRKLDRKTIKRTLNDQPKSATNNFNHSEGSEPIVFSPFQLYGNSRYVRQSLYKWKRGPPTKEELDEEIDTYMAETKLKTPAPAAEDVDSFVQEYMMETEKCISQNENINLSADYFE